MFQVCPRIVPEILRVILFCCDIRRSGDKNEKVQSCIAAGPHRVLTIEVWHQTSGNKGANNLRDVQLVPAGIDMEACHRKCVSLLR